MRQLTKAQKKVINKFIEDSKNEHFWDPEKWLPDQEPYIIPIPKIEGGGTTQTVLLLVDNIPYEIYEKLEELNDTEILWTNTNRYVSDQSIKLVDDFREQRRKR